VAAPPRLLFIACFEDVTAPKSLRFLAKLAFSALLLWFVLSRVDLAGINARLRAADIRWLAPSLLIGPAAVLLAAWRWQVLSLGLLRFGEAVRYTWIGIFFGSIVPGMVGGDVAKGVSLAAKTMRTREVRLPLSIVVDKLVGFWVLLLGFIVVALIMLGLQPQLFQGMRSALGVAAGVTAAGLVALGTICHPRGATWFAAITTKLPTAALRAGAVRAFAAFGSYDRQGRVLLKAALISAVIHALNALSFWFVMRALAIPASIWFAAVFYPLLSTLLALPVSVSGVGVRDVFAASMFTAFGLNPESGVAFSWLLLGMSVPSILIGGGVQLWEIFHRRPAS
jgi:uncharacterized membrane protein YbhN (UPF0104 family)